MIRKLSAVLAVSLSCLLWVSTTGAAIQNLSLDAHADDTSTFYEYWSDAFTRINLRDPAPNEFRQRMHLISDPSVFFGPIDAFPNDNDMKFGSIQYDDSTLVSGTGFANITGAKIGVYASADDPNYKNFGRFSLATDVTSVAGNSDSIGTVRFFNNVPVAVDLKAGLKVYGDNILGSKIPGEWLGTFATSNGDFTLHVDGEPFIDPIFEPGGTKFHMEWLFTGALLNVAVQGDSDNNRVVDGGDYIAWADHFNQETANGPFDGDYDFNGVVNGDDYIIWADNFAVAATALAVPEPSSLLLAGCAACAVGVIGSRRRTGSGAATARKN
jgi:hypothetical protein